MEEQQEREAAEAPGRPFPAIGGAIWLMLGGWGAGLLAGGVVVPFLGMEATTAVGNVVGLGLMTWLGVRRAERPAREVLLLRGFPLRLLLPMFFMAFSGSILVAEVGNLVQEVFPLPEVVRDLFLRVLKAEGLHGFLWRAALLSLMAPVTEELMFRGVFQSGLVKNYGPAKGIALTAACFGIFHLIPWQALGAMLIGVLLGVVVYRTGSIFAGMALHAIWNFLPLLAVSLLKGVALEGYGLDTKQVTHVPAAALLWNATIFLVAFGSFWRRTERRAGIQEGEVL